jgi:peptide/nickel transport system permease protein
MTAIPTDNPTNSPHQFPGKIEQVSQLLPGGASHWSDAARRLRRDRSAMLCLAVIVLYSLLAIGASLYEMGAKIYNASHSDNKVELYEDMYDFNRRNLPPSLSNGWQAVLGTDWQGTSVLIKTILGAKVSLTVGLMTNIIAVPLGMILGAIAGYYGRFLDDIIVWLYSTFASIPGIIMLMALKYSFKGVTVLGLDLGGIHGIYIALGLISWVGTCRLVRAEVMKIRELDYVIAARAIGRHSFSIMMRHVMPNVMHIGIINFSLGFIGAIGAEVTLSFLGLGVAIGTPSWGSMIDASRTELSAGRWWEFVAAVTAMFFLVLALNIFGDRLRDALDPRLKNA